jgi:hypothetical protein
MLNIFTHTKERSVVRERLIWMTATKIFSFRQRPGGQRPVKYVSLASLSERIVTPLTLLMS